MLCDQCKKNEAVYHTVTKYNGKRIEVHLCADCRRANLSGMRTGPKSAPKSPQGDRRKNKVCPYCGTTLDEFMSGGYVGCEYCYTVFMQEIDERLPKMRQGQKNIGKAPSRVATTVEGEYNRVNVELQKAIAAEDYERATYLTAKLKKLRNEY